jgi:hypothetical protein
MRGEKNSLLGEVHYVGEGPYWIVAPSIKKKTRRGTHIYHGSTRLLVVRTAVILSKEIIVIKTFVFGCLLTAIRKALSSAHTLSSATSELKPKTFVRLSLDEEGEPQNFMRQPTSFE